MLVREGLIAAIAALTMLASAAATAEEKPLWEVGLGVGALAFPDYRGSNETRAYPIPVPHFVYRGEFLKADREGVRGELFSREFVELSISLDASIPVNSEDNAARRGMPDLKPIVEIGPSLDVHLWKSRRGRLQLDLVLPLRAPITVAGSPQSIGWVFAPRMNLDIDNIGGQDGWTFGVGAGPLIADRRYHDYFYSVGPQFATSSRREYEADGGYSGAHVLMAASKRFPGYWVGAFMRYDVLSGAAFENSPLVKQSSYLAGGVGIAWMIGRSKRMVEVKDLHAHPAL